MVDRLDFDRTYDDPVVAAVHENRHRILARFGNDIEAYTAFVAKRRIPGAKYVATASVPEAGLDYSAFASISEGSGVLVACEPGG